MKQDTTKPSMPSVQADIRLIALALNASHNTVTTDVPDAQDDETHWRINHAQELAALERIASALNTNICP